LIGIGCYLSALAGRIHLADGLLPVLTLADKTHETGVLDSGWINGKTTFYFKERNGLTVVQPFSLR